MAAMRIQARQRGNVARVLAAEGRALQLATEVVAPRWMHSSSAAVASGSAPSSATRTRATFPR